MPTLAGCILARDAVRWLPDAVGSLLGHVDRLLVQVDDRTDDGTLAWLRAVRHVAPAAVAFTTYTFDPATGFSGAYNAAAATADCDWTFFLDADEVVDPEQVGALRALVARGEREGIDAFGLPRRNWWDRERRKHRAEWWPDHQWRLLRRGVQYRWRVHSAIVGERRAVAVDPEVLTLHHFNLAYRSAADWAAVNTVYDELMALDRAEGRIP